eukprot:355617-Chlamydomonas_euryale.AAC.20
MRGCTDVAHLVVLPSILHEHKVADACTEVRSAALGCIFDAVRPALPRVASPGCVRNLSGHRSSHLYSTEAACDQQQ